ncbi:hypothetical protein FIV42_22305 [Persicimonas caeni]|uniref:Uncharacterized protein n=1 Tax=Persicimonas caeni TaxID=2292766 RepID=A0A4Y6Q047_PERCE|nr:hypothetical protein [Persicimonas caeni]QDG53375.1 hypothetical protein FIV42_22305 [Persicimonas caeni]QED34596.1 hypothetical protein FRD00_22300 [Persicimonas caeni]
MERSYRRRWRNTRDTIPARRRRRRTHRRDHKRGGTYYPMRVDPQSALRGVRTRLVGAVIAASTTLVCVLYAMLTSMSSFGSTFALTFGLCSFGAAVALLLSARHEEEVHELASEFNDRHRQASEVDSTPTTPSTPRALPEPNPLEGAELFERTEMRGVRKRSYSEKTDGVI